MKMTLSSASPNTSTPNDKSPANSDNRSLSPNSSPRSSPRPSPRPQNRREHNKSDSHLTVNYKDSFKQDNSYGQGNTSIVSNASDTSLSADKSSDTPAAPTKDRKDGKTKKKSSWLNSFYPTYKSRSEDFKKLFKEVPDDERLVVDYSCALQKEILVQGRLYITQNYLCFYANIFGWETNVTLKWKEVAAITKEKTALVIPNAVLICTRSEKYFFTSFVTRDKTYLMLFRVWQNALMDQPMAAQEMWQWVHLCYGDELGLTSDDEDYIAPGTEEDKLLARLSGESFSEECVCATEGTSDVVNMEEEDLKQPSLPVKKNRNSDLPTDMSDNSDSEVEKPIQIIASPKVPRSFPIPVPSHPPTPDSDENSPVLESPECIKCTSSHEGRRLLDEVFPVHVDQLFTLLFTSSKFYLDFHASRKTTDLTQTPWIQNPLDKSKSRVVTQTVALNYAMGPKTAQVTETQMMLPISKAGLIYSIDVESVQAGIPYADSFCVLFHYCLQKVTESSSSILVTAQIKYKKSVFGLVKGMIERNCWSGLEDFFNALNKALQIEAEESIPEVKRKSRKHIKRSIISRIEESRSSIPNRKKAYSYTSILNSDIAIIIVFSVLILLLIINVMLYYKLWSLEEAPGYTVLDLNLLQVPPKSHDEWIKLLQQQESLHTVEVQKWQKILKASIHLLRQVEESLAELQQSIHPTYTNKVLSLVKQEDVLNSEKSSEL